MYNNHPLPVTGFLHGVSKSIVSAMIAVMPKCSLCVAAYLNLFNIMGISVTRYYSWVFPILTVLLGISLTIGFFKARKLKNYFTFFISLVAVIILLISKTWWKEPLLAWVGLGIFMLANIIQLVQSRRRCGVKRNPEIASV